MDSENTQQRRPEQSTSEERSVGRLIRELMVEVMSLVRNEAALAQAEVSEKVSQIQTGIISVVVAVVLLLIGLIGLMFGGIYGLALILPMWLSALIVGGAIVIVGLIALLIARSKLKANNMTLNRTTDEFRKEASFARERLQ